MVAWGRAVEGAEGRTGAGGFKCCLRRSRKVRRCPVGSNHEGPKRASAGSVVAAINRHTDCPPHGAAWLCYRSERTITPALALPSICEIAIISQRRRREAAVFCRRPLLPHAPCVAALRVCARFSASLKPATQRIGVLREPAPASHRWSRDARVSLATRRCFRASAGTRRLAACGDAMRCDAHSTDPPRTRPRPQGALRRAAPSPCAPDATPSRDAPSLEPCARCVMVDRRNTARRLNSEERRC